MIALLALLAAQTLAPDDAQETPSPRTAATQTSVIDWAALPPLPWRTPPQITPDVTDFVATEYRARRCLPREGQPQRIDVDVAVMVRGDGSIRAVVPRAIECPTVEQFVAGLVISSARNNLRQPSAGWYRTALSFAWSR